MQDTILSERPKIISKYASSVTCDQMIVAGSSVYNYCYNQTTNISKMTLSVSVSFLASSNYGVKPDYNNLILLSQKVENLNITASITAGYASGQFSIFGAISNLNITNSYFNVSVLSVVYQQTYLLSKFLYILNIINSQINVSAIAVLEYSMVSTVKLQSNFTSFYVEVNSSTTSASSTLAGLFTWTNLFSAY